ncbi:hypothetical protein BLSTO_03660, partial [Blastocystis sp. subtype 1]
QRPHRETCALLRRRSRLLAAPASSRLKSDLVLYRRFYSRCLQQVEFLTHDDFSRKNEAYLAFVAYQKKLQELYDEIMLLIKDTPGFLSQDQINSLQSSMATYQAKVTQLKAVPAPIESVKRREQPKEEKKDTVVNLGKRAETQKKPDITVSSPSLNEMRSLLGLNAPADPSASSKLEEKRHQQFKDDMLNEIIDRTSRIREVGKAIQDTISESNRELDRTSDLQDRNIHAVEKQTARIQTVRSSFCGSIFRDLKYLILAGVVFFLCFLVILLLPKPKWCVCFYTHAV